LRAATTRAGAARTRPCACGLTNGLLMPLLPLSLIALPLSALPVTALPLTALPTPTLTTRSRTPLAFAANEAVRYTVWRFSV
jgi:hypothetical protein